MKKILIICLVVIMSLSSLLFVCCKRQDLDVAVSCGSRMWLHFPPQQKECHISVTKQDIPMVLELAMYRPHSEGMQSDYVTPEDSEVSIKCKFTSVETNNNEISSNDENSLTLAVIEEGIYVVEITVTPQTSNFKSRTVTVTVEVVD